MKMLDVHGMTETTGAFIANMPAEFRLGTVGRPVAGMEVTIADDRKILPRVYGGSLAELAAASRCWPKRPPESPATTNS
jgi:acyl-coenzyme A synthetase/AMP-(fatty) acid ligase